MQVSWVRHRDVHILSSNGVTFTSDSRFKVRADEDAGSYLLIVRAVAVDDEGSYECQISTKPTKTLIVNLFVTGEWEIGRENLSQFQLFLTLFRSTFGSIER